MASNEHTPRILLSPNYMQQLHSENISDHDAAASAKPSAKPILLPRKRTVFEGMSCCSAGAVALLCILLAVVLSSMGGLPAITTPIFLSKLQPRLALLVQPLQLDQIEAYIPLLVLAISAFASIIIVYQSRRPPPCYLLDFACSVGDGQSFGISAENFGRFLRSWRSVHEGNLKFQYRVFVKSGVSDQAYVPMLLLERAEDADMHDARVESENLISQAARNVLQKTGIDAKQIDIVVLNSSLFNPVPSLTAFLVHDLHMRSNVKSFNLAGMGCSAGLIAIDLASRLLKVHHNSYALVISTENITSNMYYGNDMSMMISNCLFRCGCSAALLTNKRSVRSRCKLQLLHCVRTNMAADERAYECVHHKEDGEGKLGVSLKTSLIQVAGVALRANITRLAPLILPWSELIKVGMSMVKKSVLKKAGGVYEPNFKKAIDHFCVHPGGRAVLDAIAEGLKLSTYDMEPGRMALDRFGNTSSSGIWFALQYCECKGRLRRGGRVWQIALGSGFKCNSAVWRVLRDIEAEENLQSSAWGSCIERYPPSAAALEERAALFRRVYGSLFEGVEDGARQQ